MVSGRLQASHFDDLLGRIQDRIGGWKSRLLSNRARLLLLKHMLSGMPIHLLSILQVPKSVIVAISRSLSNFFWGYKDGKRNKHWKDWASMSLPTSEGGIGIRNFQDVQKSLHMKLAWKLLTVDPLWSRFLKPSM